MCKASIQTDVRPPAVAGRFYPGDVDELTRLVDDHLRLGADAWSADEPPPKVLIAPHAGFVYSGPIAGVAFAGWASVAKRIDRVVLLGPSHHVPFEGVVAPSVRAFATPLGDVPVDRDAVNRLTRHPFVQVDDGPHSPEHALETHLPYLQRLLGDFAIVPLLVGQAEPSAVAYLLNELWGDDGTAVAISSDLSHFLPYDQARRADRRTADTIEARSPTALGPRDACGFMSVNGMLYVARQRQMRVRTMDLRNSGDTAGPQAQVVGYGAFAFG